MATIICNKSSIEFKCEHFPRYLSQGETSHPIFYSPLKRLWKVFPKWQNGELTATDSYLYFLSLLNATDLVHFRTPAIRTERTDSIIAANMEALYSAIGSIITIKHPKFAIPQFVISKDTRNLNNVSHWIKIWTNAYGDFLSGLKDEEIRTRLERKSASLERLIKNPSIRPEKYAVTLSEWADQAASFPIFETKTPFGNIPLNEYWKQIIQRCYRTESLLAIPSVDIEELLDHCEDNIELGSVQSYHLFNTIREGLDSVRGFFSIGLSTFSILDSDSSNEDIGNANMNLLVSSIGAEMPKRTEYPSDFAFMRAKMKWNLAKGAI